MSKAPLPWNLTPFFLTTNRLTSPGPVEDMSPPPPPPYVPLISLWGRGGSELRHLAGSVPDCIPPPYPPPPPPPPPLTLGEPPPPPTPYLPGYSCMECSVVLRLFLSRVDDDEEDDDEDWAAADAIASASSSGGGPCLGLLPPPPPPKPSLRSSFTSMDRLLDSWFCCCCCCCCWSCCCCCCCCWAVVELAPLEDLSPFLEDREEGFSRISVREIFLPPSEDRPPGREVLRCMVKRLMLNGMAIPRRQWGTGCQDGRVWKEKISMLALK